MTDKILTPAVRWTDDCQGKKDYDGPLIEFSSRYWPSGGGFHILDSGGFRLSNDPTIRPSAVSSILLLHGEPDENGHNSDYITLAGAKFEADSELEVRAQVEAWVAEKFGEISKLMLEHFKGGVKE